MNLFISHSINKTNLLNFSLLFIVVIIAGCQKKVDGAITSAVEMNAETATGIQQLNVLNAGFFTHQTSAGKIFIAGSDGEIISNNEANRWRATSTPDFNDKITAIAADDPGIKLVTVGENGLIALSEDSGSHWKKLPSISSQTITTVLFDKQHQHWVAAGEHGLMLYSDSSARNWKQVSPGNNATISKIISLPTRLIAIGENGFIAQSSNGGINWEIIPPLSTAALTDITITETHVLISSADGSLVRGKLDNNSWELITTGFSTYLSRIFYNKEQKILLCLSSDGDVMLSDDGGNLWAPVSQGNRYLSSIAQSNDGKFLLAAGDQGQLLISDNAGRTWTSQQSPVKSNIEGAIPSGESGFIVYGEFGLLMQSENFHTPWQIINYPIGEFTHQLLAASPDNWIVAGAKGTILQSINQGKTWQPLTTPAQESDYFLSAVQDKKSGNRIVAGPPGTIFVTNPDTNQWRVRLALSDANQGYFHRVVTNDEGTAIAIAGPGTTHYSSDAGDNWQAANIDNSKQLFNAIYDQYRQQFIAVGQEGIIQFSADGKTWTVINTGITQSLQTVYATKGEIWAAGDQGVIIQSTDNGKSWQDKTNSSRATVLALFETTSHTLIATGTHGYVARWDSNGKYWQQISAPTQASWRTPVQDAETGIIYIPGKTGEIIYSNDDGLNWKLLPPVTQGSVKSLFIDTHNKMLIGIGERLIRIPLLTWND